MVERFNRTCLMMLSMFVNDQHDNWHELLPHPFAAWVRDALEVAYDQVRHSLNRTAARRKRFYDVKAVNRKFSVGSWVLRYHPPAAQKKLGSPWVGPQQVVRQATGHTVGIKKGPDAPIIFIHVDDLKMCPAPPGDPVDTRTTYS